MLSSLDLPREDSISALNWLENSQTHPEEFWGSLFAHNERSAGRLKSKFGVAYDFYADSISRHRASSERDAMIEYDPREGWVSLSYLQLDTQAAATASSWAAQGVKSGQTLAIVQELGRRSLVALAAGLRLGLIISILSPQGEVQLAKKLAALKPDHLVLGTPGPAKLDEKWLKKALNLATTGAPPSAPPPAYAPGAPWARVFSPVRDPLDVPLEVPAELGFLHALRDVIFALRLGPGSRFAAPGAHFEQYQPSLLLASLLAGATYIHIPIELLEKDLSILYQRPPQVLLLTERLRAALAAGPARPLPGVSNLIRAVDEPFDWTAYQKLLDLLKWRAVPVTNILADPAEGGCVLFSCRRPGSINAKTLPSAARPWALFDVLAPERAAPGGHGVFSPVAKEKPLWKGWFILARAGGEYLYGSTLEPRRAGRIFPAGAVAAALPASTPGCVIPVALPSTAKLFILLAFAGAAEKISSPAEISAALEKSLGGDGVPDAIEIWPLYPHQEGEKLDPAWCAMQYLLGRFAAKRAHPTFQKLTALRGMLAGR